MLYVRIPGGWEDGDFSEFATVHGHEGRNRMYAFSDLCGAADVEVHIIPLGGYRARHLKPTWIKALQRGMFSQVGHTLVPGPLFVTERDLAPNRSSRRKSSKNSRRTSRKRG
jgi:hypothetical protein